MLSQKVTEHLNEQINREFYSSNLYLQMSAWCTFRGLDGCAAFLQAHAAEEMDHMQRLFKYVNETGSKAVLGQIDAPPTDFESVNDIFQKTYEHECFITKSINSLVHVAMAEEDYSTFNFLQWYVAEQHEEERLFKSILDKIEIIGTEGRGLYHFDREMGNLDGSSIEG
ncbi:MAG TPA: non-heme ferritin [Chromatiales bacterium]|nr:non-heme ferritin [Thiotrichales bacterium]HIP67781.1 non-heme ferritin [Chromatiales bacterium]